MRRWKVSIILLIACLGLAVLIRITQAALDRHRDLNFVDRRPVFIPRGEPLKALSMGYRSLLADWLWIRSVLYYGRRVMDEDNAYYRYALSTGTLETELRSLPADPAADAAAYAFMKADTSERIRRGIGHLLIQGESRYLVEHIYPLLDRVVTLDPHFLFPYLFGGVYVLMDTGDVPKAVALLEKGFDVNPDRWQFPFYLGWIEWMYRGNEEATVNYLLKAVTLDDCPLFVSQLLSGLSRNLGRSEATILYLEGLFASSENPQLKQRIGELIESFRSLQSEE